MSGSHAWAEFAHLARTRAAHLEHEQANTLRLAHERDQAICGGVSRADDTSPLGDVR
jgi:hypothetical protein